VGSPGAARPHPPAVPPPGLTIPELGGPHAVLPMRDRIKHGIERTARCADGVTKTSRAGDVVSWWFSITPVAVGCAAGGAAGGAPREASRGTPHRAGVASRVGLPAATGPAAVGNHGPRSRDHRAPAPASCCRPAQTAAENARHARASDVRRAPAAEGRA
jgi:hypothetical protein